MILGLNGLTGASGEHQSGRRCQVRLHGQGLEEHRNRGKSSTSSFQQHKSLAAVFWQVPLKI